MDSSPPGSSIHRILWARILEWAAISFSSVQATQVQFLGKELRSLFRTAHCSLSEINGTQSLINQSLFPPHKLLFLPKRLIYQTLTISLPDKEPSGTCPLLSITSSARLLGPACDCFADSSSVSAAFPKFKF